MASSSQSLDFSFDALRGFGSRLFGDRPNEARKLARNRGGDHGLQFSRMGELAISTAESLLGLPGYVSDWLAQLFLAQKEIATDTCWKPVAPCRLDQHAPRRAIARLGDSALASRASDGMLGRNETQIGHELPRVGETGSPRPPARGHAALAAPSPLASATSPEARLRCGLQDDPAEPSPPRRPRCNLPARCNVLRVRTTIRRASAGASGSRPAGYNDGHGAAESRRVAGALPQHAHRRQSRAHQIADRLMGWVWNPHRRQFTRSVQFGQVNRVASVGFDPIAGLARNQRRGDYDAFVPGFAQLALNAVTARAGLIAKSKAPAM